MPPYSPAAEPWTLRLPAARVPDAWPEPETTPPAGPVPAPTSAPEPAPPEPEPESGPEPEPGPPPGAAGAADDAAVRVTGGVNGAGPCAFAGCNATEPVSLSAAVEWLAV